MENLHAFEVPEQYKPFVGPLEKFELIIKTLKSGDHPQAIGACNCCHVIKPVNPQYCTKGIIRMIAISGDHQAIYRASQHDAERKILGETISLFDMPLNWIHRDTVLAFMKAFKGMSEYQERIIEYLPDYVCTSILEGKFLFSHSEIADIYTAMWLEPNSPLVPDEARITVQVDTEQGRVEKRLGAIYQLIKKPEPVA